MAKRSSHPAALYHRVRDALANERDGLTFAKLAQAAGITDGELSRVLPLLLSCNAIQLDRRTRRYVRL